MQQSGAGWIMYRDDVETLAFDWGKVSILSEPAITGLQRMSFGTVELAPGKGHDRHNHPGAEEMIYVVAGEGEQMVGDQPPISVRPGACISIPADVYHATRNTGSEPLRLVIVYAPSGPERLLREMPGCQVLPPGRREY